MYTALIQKYILYLHLYTTPPYISPSPPYVPSNTLNPPLFHLAVGYSNSTTIWGYISYSDDGSDHQGRLSQSQQRSRTKELLLLGMAGGGKSQSEKEKTKMRERKRRGITTKMFHGLRKHGGYPLSPRADINEVLRHLALEAGWIVHPDGTTYRPISNFGKCCPVCGTARTLVIGGDGGGGGECSTSASPEDHRGLIPSLHASSSHRNPNATAGNNSDAATAVIQLSHSTYGGCGTLLGNQSTVAAAPLSVAHQQHHLQEARASNPNTPVASPMRRG